MSQYGHRLRRGLSVLHHHRPTTSLRPLSSQIRSVHNPGFSRPFKPSTNGTRAFCTGTKKAPRPERIPFQGCDYNHWLIVMYFDQTPKPSAQDMVKSYEETAAKIFGSLEVAKKKMYACSTTDYIGFQVECDEDTSEKFKEIPGVLLVLPDSYIDPEKEEYGGDKYINGLIISNPLPPGYGLLGDREDTPKLPEGENKNDSPPPPRPTMEGESRYSLRATPQQNLSTPSPAQRSTSSPQQYSTPSYPPLQQYGPPKQNFNTPPPPQQNYGPPPPQQNYGSPPPQQNYGPPPPQQQFGPPLQNFSMPPPAQPNMVYTNYSSPVTPQQNFSTPSPAQWSPSPPPPQQNYGPPPPQQNYGPPLPQQNYGTPPPQQNYGLPPPQQNYGPPPPQQNYGPPPQQNYGPPSPQQNYGPPHPPQQQYGPPQQNFNTPSPAQWNPQPHRPQQNFDPPPHPQQQYGPQSNFPQHQNYGPSPPPNYGPPPQQTYYQPGLGYHGGPPYNAF